MHFHTSNWSPLTRETVTSIAGAVLLLLASNGCAPGDQPGEAPSGDPTEPAAGGEYSQEILDSGPGWQKLRVIGTAADDGGEPYDEIVYALRGAEGVAQAPLPASIKEDLSTNGEGSDPEGTIILSEEIVNAIQLAEETGTLGATLEAIAEPLDSPTGLRAGGSGGCSPKTTTKSKTLDVSVPIVKKFDVGSGMTGSLEVDGLVSGSVTGSVTVKQLRFKFFFGCIPYAIRVDNTRLEGSAQVELNSDVDGSTHHEDHWEAEIARPPLGSLDFWIGPVPVHLGFNLPLSVGVDIDAAVDATLHMKRSDRFTGSFDYTCTTGGCSGTTSYGSSHGGSPHPLPPVYQVQGRVRPSVWAQAALRAYLYDEWLAYAQVGVRPYLHGDLWGYEGNSCGDADGDGINEAVQAAFFDLDWQVYLNAEVAALGSKPKRWGDLWHSTRNHLKFWTLAGAGAATAPMLSGPPSTAVGVPTQYSARMRPCWPYSDQMNYEISWGDGGTSSVSSSPSTWHAQDHTYGQPGTVNLQWKAASDAHGRIFKRTRSASIDVQAVPAPTWTPWLNRDSPSGTGDWEGLSDFVMTGEACPNPIDVRCQTTSGVDWTQTGEVYSCTLAGGVCVNANQPDGTCMDYQVSFLCQ